MKLKTIVGVLMVLAMVLTTQCGNNNTDSADEYIWTVTFNTNGGSVVPAQQIANGKTAVRPADPTRDGYEFDEWYSNRDLSQVYNFNTPVNANITLYAKWIKPDSGEPRINGFFIGPYLGYGIPDYEGQFKTQTYYDEWVKSMADIGATMLFYQFVTNYENTNDNTGNSWYPYGEPAADFSFYDSKITSIPGSGVAVNTWMQGIRSWTGWGMDKNPLQMVLDAGEKNDVKIWLGLYLDGPEEYSWWKATSHDNLTDEDKKIFDYHVARNIQIAKDLLEQFGDHPALGGIYLPAEIANLGFQNSKDWDTLAWILKSVSDEVHKLSDLKVAISPFFNVTLSGSLASATQWGLMWDNVLSKSSIDIIMLQDGVGVRPDTLTTTVDKISPYFKALKDACDKNGKSFWANCELFSNNVGDPYGPSKPSNIDKLLLQLRTEAEFTDTFVCWSYLSLDPYVTANVSSDYPLSARKKFYDDYKAYYDSITQ